MLLGFVLSRGRVNDVLGCGIRFAGPEYLDDLSRKAVWAVLSYQFSAIAGCWAITTTTAHHRHNVAKFGFSFAVRAESIDGPRYSCECSRTHHAVQWVGACLASVEVAHGNDHDAQISGQTGEWGQESPHVLLDNH